MTASRLRYENESLDGLRIPRLPALRIHSKNRRGHHGFFLCLHPMFAFLCLHEVIPDSHDALTRSFWNSRGHDEGIMNDVVIALIALNLQRDRPKP